MCKIWMYIFIRIGDTKQNESRVNEDVKMWIKKTIAAENKIQLLSVPFENSFKI